jgi:hypothetical protein
MWSKKMMPTDEVLPKNRLLLGGAIFVMGILCPLLVPLVASTGLSTAWKATLSGLLMLGIPEFFMLIAAAVLGKTGFRYLKCLLFGFLKSHVVPEKVSPNRYRVGLFVFFVPVIWGWIAPYFSEFVSIREYRLTFAIAGDLMLLAGLILLGGEFWEKLRSLFLHRAVVSMGDES